MYTLGSSLSLPPANGLLHCTRKYQPWVFVPWALDYFLVSSLVVLRTTPNALSEEDGTKDNEHSYRYLILPGGATSLEGRKSSSFQPSIQYRR